MWKRIGLFGSLVLQILFWVLYLSLLLVKIGSPFADILWLFGGAAGIIFGLINLIGCRKVYLKILSSIALISGIVQLAFWALAMFITFM